ncbi:hypothetical protein SDC9_13009 [bioreactor metagenome]|uniref:Uncharacterized protein n=1 Tax=bioreactor metagenome TaxID=1076179 RepID=A0A644TK31_9ZZZZ
MRSARSGAGGEDLWPRLGQRAGVQHLFGHADEGAPPDRHPLGGKRGEGAAAVEHHHNRVGALGPARLAQPPPGGEHDRRADLVERDRMGRAQRLHRGDPGNDPRRHRQHPGQPRRDAQRRIVKRRVAPDQERYPPLGADLRADLALPGGGDGVVPVVHALPVGGIFRLAHRQGEIDDTGAGHAQMGFAQRAAQPGKVRLLGALERDQHKVGRVHRLDRLQRQVPGVAGADADEGQFDHACCPRAAGCPAARSSSGIKPRGDEGRAAQRVQTLRHRQHAKIDERLDEDHRHVGHAEGRHLRDRAEALAIEGPEADPGDDAALIGGREREGLGIAQLDIGRAGRDQSLRQQLQAEERHQQRGHIHPVLRQVEGREEQPLGQQPKCQPDRRRRRAKDQEQRRAEDQMHLGHAHGHVRQHLEEGEDEGGGDRRAGDQRNGALRADRVEGGLQRVDASGGSGGIAQHQLGAGDDTGFDMHVGLLAVTPDGG